MAKIVYGVHLDLNTNEVQNVVLHALSSAPLSPSNGQLYYDTTLGIPRYYNSSSGSWYSMSSVASSANWGSLNGGTNQGNTFVIGTSGLLTFSSGVINANQYNNNEIIRVNHGGIGTSGFTNNRLLIGNGTGAISTNSNLNYATGNISGLQVNTSTLLGILNLGSSTGYAHIYLSPTPLQSVPSGNTIEYDGTGIYYTNNIGTRYNLATTLNSLSDFAGVLPVNKGGTNSSVINSNTILKSLGTSVTGFAGSASGSSLLWNGSDWVSSTGIILSRPSGNSNVINVSSGHNGLSIRGLDTNINGYLLAIYPSGSNNPSFYIDKTGFASGIIGPSGEQGIQGVPGTPGDPGLIWRGNWASGTVYTTNDAIHVSGSAFISLTTGNLNRIPYNTIGTYWDILSSGYASDVGSIGSSSGGISTFVGTTGAIVRQPTGLGFEYNTIYVHNAHTGLVIRPTGTISLITSPQIAVFGSGVANFPNQPAFTITHEGQLSHAGESIFLNGAIGIGDTEWSASTDSGSSNQGGTINLNGGVDGPGGNITANNNGGTINTTTGYIELGIPSNRVRIERQSGSGNAILLAPYKNGTILVGTGLYSASSGSVVIYDGSNFRVLSTGNIPSSIFNIQTTGNMFLATSSNTGISNIDLRNINAFDIMHSKNSSRLYFDYGSTTVPEMWTITANGGSINQAAAEVGRPGIVRLACGTGFGVAYISSNSSANAGNQLSIGGGPIVGMSSFNLRGGATLSTGTSTFTMFAGFSDNSTTLGSTPLNYVDAIGFRYSHIINSGKWEAFTRSSGVETTLDTNLAVAINTWYTPEIRINASGTLVEFFMNNNSVGSINTNIPTGDNRLLGPMPLGIFKSSGVNTCFVDLDFHDYAQIFVNRR